MVQVPIKRTVERIPGGMMVVPLFLGAILDTLAPGTARFFGSFTGALFTGALPILAVFYVCMGATLEFDATPYLLKKGGSLFLTKIVVAAIAGVVLGRLWGEAPVRSGPLAGLSALAVVAALNDTNGGLYMALMGQFGSPRDVGAYSILFVLVVTGAFLVVADRLTGGDGTAGLAAASSAGNAAAVPAIVASANAAYRPAAASATVLVATSVVVTALGVPVVTAWWHRRATRRPLLPATPGSAR